MNIKVLPIIILLLCFIFRFEKVSYSLNKVSQDDISELKILKYLPKNNKTLFISNAESSKIINEISKNYTKKDQEKLSLTKNSILAYLGVDLGTNKLEEIYNNELTITTFDNKEKDIDDILIIFKINEKKNIDDILNLTNKIDEQDKLIKIFRENKLNYLKYIYRTSDNYILTSSKKNLILDALQSKRNIEKRGSKYIFFREVLQNVKNERNVLLTKNLKTYELLNNENYFQSKEDFILTLFSFKDKEIILKSYLVNNNKSLNIMSYEKIDKKNILDKKDYQISIYNNSFNSNKYIDQININNFEKSIFKELNEKLKQDILFLISDNNWLIVFDKNNLSIKNIKSLEDLNKNSLENNHNIYTIYSKDTLKKEENIIKQSFYKKIFSIQSDNLTFISNSLMDEADIDMISKDFSNLKDSSHARYFLNKKINLKYPYSIKNNNFSYLKKINYFFKNVINVSIIDFKEIIKQSIPEITPIYYAKTNLKIL